MTDLQPGGNGSQTDSMNPLDGVASFGYPTVHEAPEAGNELGYSGMPVEYGQNDAGSWSVALSEDLYGVDEENVPVLEAQKHQWAGFSLVEGNLAGDTGPLGGSTPGSNPIG